MLQQSVVSYLRPMSIVSDVHPTTKAGIDSAVATLLMAFSTDPVARWVYPDPGDYVHYFPKFIRAFAGRSFSHGTAYLTSDYHGAALWLPPNTGPDEKTMLALIEASVSDDVKLDLYDVLSAMEDHHPREPHWYLPMIGVDGSKQGSGIGSALMASAVSRIDAEGLAAYLESTNPRNISLYERFGFEVIGTIQYGNSAPIFPMLRTPR